MHSAVGKFIRYVLWIALILILGFICIGLSKFDWNVKGYVQFLNERSRSESREQGGITNVFRGNGINGDELTIDDQLTGDIQAETGDLDSNIDVYDPSFEEDLNDIPQSDVVLDEEASEDYGFVASDESDMVPEDESTDPKDQLLELIKEREM